MKPSMFAVWMLCALPVIAQLPKERWLARNLTPEALKDLSASAKRLPFETIAPVLLKALVLHQPTFSSPDDRQDVTPQERTYREALEAWNHQMLPRRDPAKARVLLSLFRKATDEPTQTRLLHALEFDHWCPEAEPDLVALCADTKACPELRARSISTLLHHCDINTYLPTAIRISLEAEKGIERCQAFCFNTHLGNQLFTLNEANRRLLLSTGFSILRELPPGHLDYGYFVASQLGFVLKVPGEFTPDQDLPKYRGQFRRKDEFYIDTVKHALAWYELHGASLADPPSP